MDLQTGTVRSANPLLVEMDGADSAGPARRLARYQPAAGDRVLCLRYGTTTVVLDKII